MGETIRKTADAVADEHQRAIAQPHPAFDAQVVDERAVLAAQVFQVLSAGGAGDARVLTGHQPVVEHRDVGLYGEPVGPPPEVQLLSDDLERPRAEAPARPRFRTSAAPPDSWLLARRQRRLDRGQRRSRAVAHRVDSSTTIKGPWAGAAGWGLGGAFRVYAHWQARRASWGRWRSSVRVVAAAGPRLSAAPAPQRDVGTQRAGVRPAGGRSPRTSVEPDDLAGRRAVGIAAAVSRAGRLVRAPAQRSAGPRRSRTCALRRRRPRRAPAISGHQSRAEASAVPSAPDLPLGASPTPAETLPPVDNSHGGRPRRRPWSRVTRRPTATFVGAGRSARAPSPSWPSSPCAPAPGAARRRPSRRCALRRAVTRPAWRRRAPSVAAA